MPNRQPIEELALDLISREDWEALARSFASAHPADIAQVIEQSDEEIQFKLFSLIPTELQPDVLAELEEQADEVLDAMTSREISDLVGEMAPDDAADILGDLPDSKSDEILELMDEADSEEVRKLLEYPEDTAGGIMTTDVIAVKADLTAQQALDSLAGVEFDEPFYAINIVDDENRMIGYVNIWEILISKDKSMKIGDMAHRRFISVNANEDQEEVVRLSSHYDLNVIPVVDDEGRLLGRVTHDDLVDVIQEEASEDIFRLAGSDDSELEEHSVIRSCMTRLPWLFITLFGGFVTSVIFSAFSHRISNIAALSFFVPAVMAMGGNTGIQSSTLIVRSIALGSMPKYNVMTFLAKELTIGAIMGLVCGSIIGLFAYFLLNFIGGDPSALRPHHLAAVVATALFCAMTFAAAFGSCVPILLARFKIDPAVASGPFITIVNDISALAIYFTVTLLLLVSIG